MLIAGCEDEFYLCRCWLHEWTTEAAKLEENGV